MGNGKTYEMKTIDGGKQIFNGTEEEIIQQVRDAFNQLKAKAPRESSQLTLKLFCRPIVLSHTVSEIESESLTA